VTEAAIDPIDSTFTWRDRLLWWRVRWGIGRMSFAVTPGLYALNDPTPESDVLVTANYRMSVDHLRRALVGRKAWILVLDTKGINVWCAAGKGSFGTDELVERIVETGLARQVSHTKLILPQLGGVGVDAGEVGNLSGFMVRYGPVRAADLPEYLDAGYQATDAMRRVQFSLADRAALVPVEIVNAGKFILPAMAVLFVLSGLSLGGFSAATMLGQGRAAVWALGLAWLAGTVAGPLLLPWLPGRMLSLKGAMAALLLVGLFSIRILPGMAGALDLAAFWLMVPAIASFIVMNFTGATPYTSPSGVRLEMKRSVPLQAICAVLALLLWLAQRVVEVV
jgi:acetyl-CoA decarbonylase/synthase complex subunit gamma